MSHEEKIIQDLDQSNEEEITQWIEQDLDQSNEEEITKWIEKNLDQEQEEIMQWIEQDLDQEQEEWEKYQKECDPEQQEQPQPPRATAIATFPAPLLIPRYANDTAFKFFMKNFFFRGGWQDQLLALKNKIQDEYWGDNNQILYSYCNQYFAAVCSGYLAERRAAAGRELNDHQKELMEYDCGLFFKYDRTGLVVNTGLVDSSYEPVYGEFERNRNVGVNPRTGQLYQPWVFKGWRSNYEVTANGFAKQPVKFRFFAHFYELYFDANIRLELNIDHIMQVDDRHNRFVSLFPGMNDLQRVEKLKSAVACMQKRVKQNSRTVVPQCFNGKMQLLLPLNMLESAEVQLVVPVERKKVPLPHPFEEEDRDPMNPEHWFYQAGTVLDPAMAYNNARLLNALESDWLTSRAVQPARTV
ncbi:hypothetical protein B484DRAFT_430449, partial [Ochromonadaceae sp. CCMP2298]